MVSLSATAKVGLKAAGKLDKPLRCHAFWLPEIPGPQLHLNDESFSAYESVIAKHQPLRYVLFGGQNGTDLRNLTGISVSCLDNFHGIEFHYDNNSIPLERRKLGPFLDYDYPKVVHFPINGPEGELVTGVEVDEFFYPEGDTPWWYDEGPSNWQLVTRPITIDPETTITGLYAATDKRNGLIGLGAISEVINEQVASCP
ncbi:hypothetical protein DL769_010434 [Monosporascus sp. CRB-8-3]|nr:hypothetical protein DL769_010434 [Monosporascus sp. CRB-8-3]